MSRKWMVDSCLTTLLLLLIGSVVIAQSPAGASNDLQAWYKGEDVPNVATNRSNWPSGTASITADAIYRANNGDFFTIINNINTNNEVFISMDDEYFETPLDINDNTTFGELHVFTVYKPKDNGDDPIWGNGESGGGEIRRGRQVSTHLMTRGDDRSRSSYNHNGAARSKEDSAYIHYVHYRENTNSFIYINGKLEHQVGVAKAIENNANNVHNRLIFGNKRIGHRSEANINVAEFIVYSGAFTQNKRERINSYLAIKYGIPIAHNYLLADGVTQAWDYNALPGGVSYNHNMVGIGYDNDPALGNGSLFKNESTCQRLGDYLSLFAPPGTGVGDYYEGLIRRSLVVGHNNGSVTNTTAFDISNKFYDNGVRINRVWRAQQNGGYSNYTISFSDDITSQLPTGFLPGNMVVLVSDNTTFTSNVEVYPLEYVNNRHRVQNINFGTSGQSTKFFTIAFLETSMWVKADAANNVILANGQVNTLVDQGLAGNNLEGVTMPASTVRPLLRIPAANSTEMNFHPYVSLNQSGQRNYLRKTNYWGFGKAESSVFMITRNSNNTPAGATQFFLSYATEDNSGTTRAGGNDLFLTNPQNIKVVVGESSPTTGVTSGIDITSPNLNNLPVIISNEHGASTNNFLGVNGVMGNNSYANNRVINEYGTLIIGQEQDVMNDPSSYVLNQQLEGDVAELIVCSQRVSAVEANRIRTYLAIKYGIFLAHDYEDSNGDLLWDRTITGSNQNYNRTVAGIGRDDAFDLDQRKTRSQRNDAVVTIEHANTFNNDRDFLIWGSLLYKPNAGNALADYNLITAIDAPQGFTISERRWKVANPGDRVGQVKVFMDIPPSMASNLLGVRLLVSSSPTFNSGFLTAVQPTNIGTTQIEFDVTLQDGQYFTIGFDQDLSFTNNEIGAPSTYEACAGDEVTFRYKDLTEHPTTVRFSRKGGGFTDVATPAITFSAQAVSAGGFEGEMTLNIPTDAITGNVIFLGATNNSVYNSNAFMTIHNPDLALIPGTNPICAADSIRLFGFPEGGFFTSNIPGLISPNQDSLYGGGANWSANHDDSTVAIVTYNYTAEYSNGNSCPTTKSLSENVVIRDNRLESLRFATIVKLPGPVNSKQLGVDANTISTVTPNLLSANPFPHPFTFTGTYVTPPSPYIFLADAATSINNPVNFRFNNKGCIAEITSNIDVFDPLSIPGVPDTLCEEADTIYFGRDLNYSSTSSGGVTVDSNLIVEVTTLDSTHASAVVTINSTLGNEQYGFVVANLPAGATSSSIKMVYRTTRTSGGNTVTLSEQNAVGNIVIVPRPAINLGAAIDPVYCTTGDLDTLRPNPVFDNVVTTYFTLSGEDTSGMYTLMDTLFQDTIFNPSMHYDSLVPNANRDLSIRLTYTVDRYGCVDRDTAYTTIRAPLRPFFFTKPAYCRNEDPTQLNGGILPGGVVRSGTGRFEPALGLNDSTGVFDPTIAIIGKTPVTYVITDQFNCEYFYTDTLLVREPPRIFMTLDGSRNNTSFCGSVTTVDMRSTLISGSAIDSIRYFGAGVIDSTLNPNSVFVSPGGPLAGTGGTFPVWSVITDSFLCKGYDTLVVTVIQAPAIDIDSIFNGNTSNYGPNNNLIAEHTYCKSEPAFVINGNPLYRQGGTVRGTISGAGVVLIDTTYFYNPSLVPVGVEVDTVFYTYTDNVGCDNTDIAIIKLDSIPVVTLSGFGGNTSFCPNYPAIQLVGTPDTISSGGTATFAGPGINPNTGIFDPSRAGTGTKLISYQFIDNNNCVSADTVQIVVNPLPIINFTGLLNEYCTAAPDDTLYADNDTTTGTYRFYGAVIIDSTGILRPADTTGLQTVYYAYTDSLNCTNTMGVNTFIHPTPEIVINGLDSAYCFSDPEDNISVFPAGVLSTTDLGFSASGNTITFDPDQDSAGIKTFTYIHTDINRCSDTITARTYVYRPTSPTILNLDTFYCETGDTIMISANPLGGTFSGDGIWSDSANNAWAFVPEGAGVGTHTITYSLDTALVGYTLGNGQPANLVCPADTTLNVKVRPLPLPKMLSPANNAAFCSNDSAVQLLSVNYVNKTWNAYRDTSGGVVLNFSFIYDTISRSPLIVATYPDTTYYFDPGNVVDGNHSITYIATDSASGCQDSIEFTLTVDAYTDPFFALDSVYCESEDSVLLFGIPTGGTFARNSVVIPNPPYFYPNQGYASGQYLTNTIYDTVTYSFVDGACEGVDTQVIEINPVPQISFSSDSTHNTYCLGGDTVLLTPSDPGGLFSGNGVPFQSNIFIPNLAGGGTHPISYYLMDTATGCDNRYIDTLYVYSMPNVDFSVDGGCQFDSVRFKPNNAILGLTSNSQFVDSITSVQWVMSTTFDTTGSIQNGKIDSVDYLYTTAGIYEPQLIVANREHCIDTQTIRLVISPKINSYPYVQDFETDAGNWFAESRDSNRTLLWEWGIDSNALGVASNVNNHLWSTQNNRGYSKEESAWVYSPCFDISRLERPMISLDYWSDTRVGIDGTVLEYQKPDGSWARVGELDRGINWFDTRFIAAEPGDDTHRNFPTGWSGQSGGWKNGRYKLDDYRGPDNNLRLRVAFSSLKNDPQRAYDGFAFDNVVIRDRTRNVLLETMVHESYGNMENINNYIYQLVHHTNLNKDVVMLQYHIESANGAGNGQGGTTDAFYNHNTSLGNTRNYEYNGPPAGRSFINGLNSNQTYTTFNLTEVDFEQDMLETPKFSVSIDTFTHINGNFRVVANVKALQTMPQADYRIYVVISEDSLNYPNGSSYISQIHTVARENDQNFLSSNPSSGNLYDNRAWAPNDIQRVEFNWNHTSNGFINYTPGHFHAVVFIQDIDTKEIFQVATTRDVSGYWVGVDPIQAEEELNEIQNMVLFPNPAHDHFNLRFDQVLEHDYQWKLVNIQGVEVRQGEIRAGNDQFSVEGLDCPPGTYIMLLYNDKVFVNRKVVLGRP